MFFLNNEKFISSNHHSLLMFHNLVHVFQYNNICLSLLSYIATTHFVSNIFVLVFSSIFVSIQFFDNISSSNCISFLVFRLIHFCIISIHASFDNISISVFVFAFILFCSNLYLSRIISNSSFETCLFSLALFTNCSSVGLLLDCKSFFTS